MNKLEAEEVDRWNRLGMIKGRSPLWEMAMIGILLLRVRVGAVG